MRRIVALTLAVLSICVLTVSAAPKKPKITAETYILPDAFLAETATYHGDGAEPAFEKGTNDGKAMRFDGTEYLTVDISALAAPYTLTAWVNWQGTTPEQRIFTVQKTASENYLSLSPWTDTAVVGGAAANGVTLLTSCYKEQFLRENYFNPTAKGVSDTLVKNNWYHIAVAVAENTVTVYIDGVEWKTVTLPFAYAELGADTLYIGAAADGNNRFVGFIQEATMYSDLLDATAVARLAANAAFDDDTVPVTTGKYAATPALPAESSLAQVKSVILDANQTATFTDTTPAFWENPQLASGQTVSGTLTVQNKSGNPVSLKLDTIQKPAHDTPAYQYLSEINVTVVQGDEVLYDGAYTALLASHLSLYWPQLANEREHTYTITLSRPFSATAAVVDVPVTWEWETAFFPVNENPLKGIPQSGWLIILLCVSAVAVGFSFYWAVVRRPRRIFTVWDKVASTLRKENTADTEDTE